MYYNDITKAKNALVQTVYDGTVRNICNLVYLFPYGM
jgi:hypothetical protein